MARYTGSRFHQLRGGSCNSASGLIPAAACLLYERPLAVRVQSAASDRHWVLAAARRTCAADPARVWVFPRRTARLDYVEQSIIAHSREVRAAKRREVATSLSDMSMLAGGCKAFLSSASYEIYMLVSVLVTRDHETSYSTHKVSRSSSSGPCRTRLEKSSSEARTA